MVCLPSIQDNATDEKIATASIFTPCTDGWKKCFKCDDRSQFLVRRVNTSCMTTTIFPHNKMFLRSKRFSFFLKMRLFLLQKVERKKFFAQQFSPYFSYNSKKIAHKTGLRPRPSTVNPTRDLRLKPPRFTSNSWAKVSGSTATI